MNIKLFLLTLAVVTFVVFASYGLGQASGGVTALVPALALGVVAGIAVNLVAKTLRVFRERREETLKSADTSASA